MRLNQLIRILTSFLAVMTIATTSNAACFKGQTFAISKDLQWGAIHTSGDSAQTILWNLVSSKLVPLEQSGRLIEELLFTDDGKSVIGVSSKYGPKYFKWDVPSGKMTTLNNQQFSDGVGNTASNMSKGSRFITTSLQRAFGGWGYMVTDLQTGDDIFSGTYYSGQGVTSEDGKTFYLVQSAQDFTSIVSVIDLKEKKVKAKFEIPYRDHYKNRISWLSNEKLLFTEEARIRILNLEEGKFETEYNDGGNILRAWLDDMSKLFYVDEGMNHGYDAYIVSPFNGNKKVSLRVEDKNSIMTARFSPDLKSLAVIYEDGKFATYDTESGATISTPSCMQ